MSNTSKLLIGALVALNVGLVGLLFFREQSVAPAAAVTAPVAELAPSAPPVATNPSSFRNADAETAAAATAAAATAAAATAAAASAAAAAPATAIREDSTIDPSFEPTAAASQAAPEAKREPAREPETRTAPPPRPRAERRRPAPVAPQPSEPEAREQRHEPETQVASHEPTSAPNDDFLTVADWREQRRPARRPAVKQAPPVTLSLDAGTSIAIRLDYALHSRQLQVGDKFEASLADDILVDGKRLATAGDPVAGVVSDIREAGRVKGLEQLSLTLVELSLAGKTFPIQASTLTMTAEQGTEKDAKVVGAATAIGAILGGIRKGKKGAAKGAATGAAAGAGVVLATKGSPVELPAGSELGFTLSQSVRVTLPSSQDAPDPLEPELEDLETEPASPGVARR